MKRAAAIDRRHADPVPRAVDPAIEALVQDVIGQAADKWTMLILEALQQQGALRFTQLGKVVGGISQEMLTKTVRQMECDGLVMRTVHPVIPPHVDYRLTGLGESLSAALCGVRTWAETYYDDVQEARKAFRAREGLR
ncbi:winged helix-turn-helix transcriptional regulator [uncultured Methylobacterium sp.]|uniref:winged helix-turn-helix transcriptional regulator n=1 Tax=uncultured Methylobacterium sp. TaxID=157278 RepID=UPI0035CBC405